MRRVLEGLACLTVLSVCGTTLSALAQAAPRASADSVASPGRGSEAAAPKVSSNKRARRKSTGHHRRRADPNAPVATYPGFRMLPNGASELFVRVSKRADVQMDKSAGRVALVLGNVHVGNRNNTNPLVTTHFDTPLSRARLTSTERGAELVLDLREPVVPTFSVSEASGGSMLVVVSLPPAAHRYSGSREPLPPRAEVPSAE